MPRYVIDEAALTRNLEILASVRERAGVKILLAQKAFSCFELYPLVAKYLDGATASGLFEARLAHEEMPGKENHVFAPAFRAADMPELLPLVNHIVFNSPRQLELHAWMARAAGVSVGLRVNPEVSVATTPAYDPCRPGSRLGVTRGGMDAAETAALHHVAKTAVPHMESRHLGGLIDGLHFHCLCEQGVEELRKVLAGFEAKFGDLLPLMKWVNFGGGHHITRADYDVDGLVELLLDFRRRYPHLTVYLEPGEAVALNAGTLEATVLEIQPPGADGVSNAILDVSAACHMPDVLEMPYMPRVRLSAPAALSAAAQLSGASPLSSEGILRPAGPLSAEGALRPAGPLSAEGALRPAGPLNNLYRFGGPTCLAGDVIGTYSFPRPLMEGDTVVFEDMAIYSMVKNNTFNGMPLPSIAVRRADGTVETLKAFGYADFKGRLG